MLLTPSTIKNIIFDLGGVIMNISFLQMMNSFKNLGFTESLEPNASNHFKEQVIEDFEIGKISPQQFREYVRQKTSQSISDQQIDDAINSILLDVPSSRIDFLKRLKRHYRIFLFSNTNQINEDCYRLRLKKQFGIDIFTELFEESFFSHHIGYRKPSLDGFAYILQKGGLKPEETVFVDDMAANVEGASRAGIHAIQLKKGMEINDLFNEKLEIIL